MRAVDVDKAYALAIECNDACIDQAVADGKLSSDEGKRLKVADVDRVKRLIDDAVDAHYAREFKDACDAIMARLTGRLH